MRSNHYLNNESQQQLPPSLQSSILVAYRSSGLGLYGALIRYLGMPLEKIALYMNSSQVSGKNQLRQAIHLAFKDGYLAPYKVVGGASAVAWFLQYSVMGMVFQICDRAISASLDIPVMPYGSQLMEDPSLDNDDDRSQNDNTSTAFKQAMKIILAPAIAGTIESVVSNRAEVQRYYGIQKFAQVESSLQWNAFRKMCGPAFIANSSRNCIMSATSFVVTPVLYRNYYPQEEKSKSSLFWFGLGVNVFLGNTFAITQQSLWGRALDYATNIAGKEGGGAAAVARNINYREVIQNSLKTEGISAFYTVPKWASRVMMNAPVQGTLPWFYNEVLPLAEGQLLNLSKQMYSKVLGSSTTNYEEETRPLNREITSTAKNTGLIYSKEKTTATSPYRSNR